MVLGDLPIGTLFLRLEDDYLSPALWVIKRMSKSKVYFVLVALLEGSGGILSAADENEEGGGYPKTDPVYEPSNVRILSRSDLPLIINWRTGTVFKRLMEGQKL